MTISADWNPPGPKLMSIFSSITAESWTQKFPESVEHYNKLNPEPDFDRLIKNVVAMWTDLSSSGYVGDNFKKMTNDILIIRGDDDHLMPFSSVEKLKESLPHAKFLNVPFSGHLAHNDQNEIVGKIIHQFLK